MRRIKCDIQLKLAHPKKHWQKRKNKAYCQLTQDRFKDKQVQIGKAVECCHKNGKRGWAALGTGTFLLIKDVKTINRRLDGEVVHDEEKSYCSILTKDGELQIVRPLTNRNRCIESAPAWSTEISWSQTKATFKCCKENDGEQQGK